MVTNQQKRHSGGCSIQTTTETLPNDKVKITCHLVNSRGDCGYAMVGTRAFGAEQSWKWKAESTMIP